MSIGYLISSLFNLPHLIHPSIIAPTVVFLSFTIQRDQKSISNSRFFIRGRFIRDADSGWGLSTGIGMQPHFFAISWQPYYNRNVYHPQDHLQTARLPICPVENLSAAVNSRHRACIEQFLFDSPPEPPEIPAGREVCVPPVEPDQPPHFGKGGIPGIHCPKDWQKRMQEAKGPIGIQGWNTTR